LRSCGWPRLTADPPADFPRVRDALRAALTRSLIGVVVGLPDERPNVEFAKRSHLGLETTIPSLNPSLVWPQQPKAQGHEQRMHAPGAQQVHRRPFVWKVGVEESRASRQLLPLFWSRGIRPDHAPATEVVIEVPDPIRNGGYAPIFAAEGPIFFQIEALDLPVPKLADEPSRQISIGPIDHSNILARSTVGGKRRQCPLRVRQWTWAWWPQADIGWGLTTSVLDAPDLRPLIPLKSACRAYFRGQGLVKDRLRRPRCGGPFGPSLSKT
jgi:hypothetical protein